MKTTTLSRYASAIVLGAGVWCSPSGAAELRVVAASSAQEALQEIANRFERDTGHQVWMIFGASGKFYTQLTQGAPFDVYFSADNEYPAKLHAQGLVEAPRRYARGRLVLWAPTTSPLEVTKGMGVLRDSRIKKLAIANPKLAPHGRAAVEAMRAQQVSASLVMGENVAQTAQFVDTGGADLGMFPLSLALSSKLATRGKYWLIPDAWHAPIDSDAAVVSASLERQVAKQFLDYCTSAKLKAVWRRYGLADE